VPAASLHVTLAFLGERPEDEVDAIGAAVVAAAGPVPGLSLRRTAWLPPGRPGVLAVDLTDAEGACAALHRRVACSLVELGAYERERRPFRPHVTVARVRRGTEVRKTGLPDLPKIPPFAGEALTLFRSTLQPGGARYEPIARVAL
jgi:2'-5' RNA ligase